MQTLNCKNTLSWVFLSGFEHFILIYFMGTFYFSVFLYFPGNYLKIKWKKIPVFPTKNEFH